MAKQASAAQSASARLPRGTKPVAQAFLDALDAVPEQSRAAVSKAALSMIRDEIKASREKSAGGPIRIGRADEGHAKAQSRAQDARYETRKAGNW